MPTSRPVRRNRPRTAEPAAAGDRRRRIVDAAARRFALTGFEATTVRQIADDVQLLSGSLYHHFATKDAILHEVVRDAGLRVSDNARRIAGTPANAELRLVALIVYDLVEMTDAQIAHAILYNERKLFRRSEEFRYVLQAKRDAYTAWRAVLEDGIAEKLFNPDLDLFLLIQSIVRMLNTAADWYRNEEASSEGSAETYSLDRVIDFHLAFVLNAIRARGRACDPIPPVEGEAPARAGRHG